MLYVQSKKKKKKNIFELQTMLHNPAEDQTIVFWLLNVIVQSKLQNPNHFWIAAYI